MHARRLVTLALSAIAAIGALPANASAERLPVRKYSTTDGLSSDYIIGIYRDTRGFLWFSTRDGLSRFDGYRFKNYGVADGLPSATVNSVLETRAGIYWIATNGGGVCRLNPVGRRPAVSEAEGKPLETPGAKNHDALFITYQVGDEPEANRVNVLYEDRAGLLWAGTDAGLFRMDSEDGNVSFQPIALALSSATSRLGVSSLVEDSEGSLWVGGGWGLTRRLPDGRLVQYLVEPKGAQDSMSPIAFTNQRQVWVGMRDGLIAFEPESASSFAETTKEIVRTLRRHRSPGASESMRDQRDVARARWYTTAEGLPNDNVSQLFVSGDQRLWIGTGGGVSEFDGRVFHPYTAANGLTDNHISALADDSAGNLWIGSVAGVTRLSRHGLVSYGEADGLGNRRVHWLGQDTSGALVAVANGYLISRFDGRRFMSTRPPLPPDAACAWMSPCGYLDHRGEWWIVTTTGVYRLPKVDRFTDLASQAPVAVYTKGNGLPDGDAHQVFEDGRRDLWIGIVPSGLAQWRRASGSWRSYEEADGMPPPGRTMNMPSAFAEDRLGSLWVGFHNGGVARVRNGRVEMFTASDGVPAGLITALLLDQTGRLWIGSNQAGLARVDDPGAQRPKFSSVAVNSSLASPNVRCLIDDAAGRIYAGTSRGIDRIDPASGHVKHFGAGEGLASEFVMAAFRDKHGMLWFGTISGLSRLDPAAEPAFSIAEPPAVMISALRVRGVPQRVSELGEPEAIPLRLSADQNQLEIEFFGVSFDTGESLKYQYRIEGIDDDWSPPSELRTVNYARLPSGSHRFLVKTVSPDGVAGKAPAIVSFTVLPPIYARWWFIVLAALVTGAAGLVAYRARVAQLLRVERVRARIATDLHDDIGASLSQIAILAEVAKQRGDHQRAELADSLQRIAETSRTLVDSMSDIVWAVNPEADSVGDLVHRMRRFAEDTLSGSDIDLTFSAPDGQEDLRLGADLRREIYLMLKESVTNIAKHSTCTAAAVEFVCDSRHLRLRVSDNGQGFDPAQGSDGNGVASMRRRVAALGSKLVIDSAPGRGTTIVFEVDRRHVSADVGPQFLRL